MGFFGFWSGLFSRINTGGFISKIRSCYGFYLTTVKTNVVKQFDPKTTKT
jgi:hypothetical protein